MAELVFEYQAMIQELESFRRTVSKGLSPQGVEGVDHVARELRRFQGMRSHGPFRWETAAHAPITTQVSKGEFMPQSRGGMNIYGEVTFVWCIANHGRMPSKHTPFREFALAGNASIRVELKKTNSDSAVDGQLVAMWRFEVGAEDGPGCHFHTQVLGREVDVDLFPHAVDVPRLPVSLFAPVDALEFVLGELFQDQWEARWKDQSSDMVAWRRHQEQRLSRLLCWQRSKVVDSLGSPWMALKVAKPESDLFTKPAKK